MFRDSLTKRLTSLFLVLAMLFTLIPAVKAAGVTTVDRSDTNIQYFGRWDKEEDGCYRSYWGGAYFKVNFTGDILKLKFSGGCDIMVNVDGQGAVTYWGANGTLDVSHQIDKSKEEHTLVVNSRFDYQEMKFVGLELAEGAKTILPQTGEIIEFIGDSITSGYGNANGASDSYSWLTASSLGYEHVQISYSGISCTDGHGYLGDFGNPSQITQYPMMQPVYYQTDALRDQLVEWDFSRYTPKAIVINMGTNDATTGVNAETFKTNYQALLELVREKNPTSVIFAVTPFGGYFRSEITQVVNAFAASDGNTHLVDTNGWLVSSDYMDGIHPTNDGQIKAAQKLRQAMEPVIGTGAISNTAPVVEVETAGPHTLPEDIVLQAVVRDDGLPNLSTVSTWSVKQAPEGAKVTFGDANSPVTYARVDKAGTYVFALNATDGELSSTEKTVTVEVKEANGTVFYYATSPLNTLNGAGIYTMWSNGQPYDMVYNLGWSNTMQYNHINVPVAGTYDVTFHYATENGKQMYASLSVNGGEERQVTFPAGATWETLMSETISVELNQWDNTLLLGDVNGDRAPNMYAITITGPVNRAEMPRFTLNGGTYHRTKTTEIVCDNPDAVIYYTTDGTDPTTASTRYTGPVTIDRSMTLKAIAVEEGKENSRVRTVEYVIDRSLSFEAEDPLNQRQGAGLLYVAGTSGDWMVYDLWTNPNNYLIFNNIDLDEAGTYHMTIHYSTDANNKDMAVDVIINGGETQRISFPGTAHVGDIQTVTISDVKLNEGVNVVKLTNSTSGVNFFDRITLEKVPEVPEHTHTLTEYPAKEATCTQEGHTTYWHCSGCGKYYADAAAAQEITLADTVTPALGHKAVKTEAKEATCTEDGNIAYWYCEECEKYFSNAECTEEIALEDTVVEAKGHEAVKTEAKEATCTEDGNIAYWYCDQCGKYFTNEACTVEIALADTVVEAKGHNFVDGVCTDCGEKDPDYTEPTDPSEPTKPTDPSEPTEPTNPSEPTEPSETTKPTEKPTETTKPATDPDGPDQTGETTNLVLLVCLLLSSAACLGVAVTKSRKLSRG